jgi:hypothetical protein
MQLLMSCLRYSKKDAARYVARKCEMLGIPVGDARRETPAENTIMHWRDRASSGARTNNLRTDYYADFITSMKPTVIAKLERAGDREAIRKEILDAFGSVCRQLAAGRSTQKSI